MRMRSHGFTLTELLVSTAIIALIGGVICAILATSYRIWKRTNVMNTAFPPAYAALNIINGELRNAAYVNITAANSVVIYDAIIEDQDTTLAAHKVAKMPLQASMSSISRYYISDSSGAEGRTTGTCLWRMTFNETQGTGATTVSARRKLADNVSSLSFQSDSTSTRILSIYSIAITVVGTDTGETYSSVFNSKIAFRNPMVSTVPTTPVFN